MPPVQTLQLPRLEAKPRRQKIGILHCCILPERIEEVEQIAEVQVSARIKANLYILKSGERIIVTERKSLTLPEDVDGILSTVGGQPQWIAHKMLNAYNKKADVNDWQSICSEVEGTWKDAFRFRREEVDESGEVIESGLRAPQIGALHAIGAHWSLSTQSATVVMPTGTGKTETMIAARISFIHGTLLVVVPTRPLLTQTLEKFKSLGLLRKLNTVPFGIRNPVVGVITKRPKSAADLEILKNCNVAITTASAVAQGTATEYLNVLATQCSHLILDEAHHLPSNTWSGLRESFANKPVLQFTATPFRRDGQPIDGKTIYNYPLRRAQEDGFFKPINFHPIFEIDAENGDRAIAKQAVKKLEEDIGDGLDHVMMARCKTIDRARDEILPLYQELGSRYNPILVHSNISEAPELIEKLRNRESRIIVCVDMLGEGFDMPQLKIAAVHDSYKSIASLLQFTGRFTRVSDDTVGDATVIANIANQDFSNALEMLYSEDADWNKLLSEFSSDAIRDHMALNEFLRNSERLDEVEEGDETSLVSPNNLLPKFSATAFKCQGFRPKRFYEGLEKHLEMRAAWLNEDANTLFFITKSEQKVNWARSKTLKERLWNFFVVYYNAEQQLLYIHTTDKSETSLYKGLAEAVSSGAVELVSGDVIFRCLGGITRLMFQNIGLKRHGRRNLRYSMYSGADVATALTPAMKANSTKSNVSGGGYEGGHPVSIGCSYKGRFWSKDQGSIQRFLEWCDGIGEKLNDESIDTDKIIENVLIPRPIGQLPDMSILCIDWPVEILHRREDRITLKSSQGEIPFSQYGIKFESCDLVLNEIRFSIIHDTHSGTYVLKVEGDPESDENQPDFTVAHVDGEDFVIQLANVEKSLQEWLNDYPPNILYVNGSELEGCDLIEPKEREEPSLPPQQIEVWDWTSGVDIKKESMWKDGVLREDSIQYKVAEHVRSMGYEIIFNDDSAGEAADLVCVKENDDHLSLKLIHCKYSSGANPGERVKDVVDVCSQAIRSSRWIWRFPDLCRHLLAREARLTIEGSDTRFLEGDAKIVQHMTKAYRFKELKSEIIIVQPGLKKSSITDDQAAVLAAAHGYLLETVNIGLDVIGSE